MTATLIPSREATPTPSHEQETRAVTRHAEAVAFIQTQLAWERTLAGLRVAHGNAVIAR